MLWLQDRLVAADIAAGTRRFRHDLAAPPAMLRDIDGHLALGFAAARDANVTVGEIDVIFPAGA
jgi:hypothetical protein